MFYVPNTLNLLTKTNFIFFSSAHFHVFLIISFSCLTKGGNPFPNNEGWKSGKENIASVLLYECLFS